MPDEIPEEEREEKKKGDRREKANQGAETWKGTMTRDGGDVYRAVSADEWGELSS